LLRKCSSARDIDNLKAVVAGFVEFAEEAVALKINKVFSHGDVAFLLFAPRRLRRVLPHLACVLEVVMLCIDPQSSPSH